jgi:hypothetical protein
LTVTLRALLAIYSRRRHNREIEERWAREEEVDPDRRCPVTISDL